MTPPTPRPLPPPVQRAPMSRAELRCTMEALGLSSDSLAAAIGVSERTIRHWLSGRFPVPAGAAADVRALEDRTAEIVRQTVAALQKHRARPDHPLTVVVHESDDDLWAAHPELRPLPARWWRTLAHRAAREVPGATLDYP